MPRFLLPLLLLAPGAGAADLLPYVLQLPADVTTVLVAETDTSTLYRYAYSEGRLQLASTSYLSIGENGVGKERAWDRRTPLGLYFVSDRLDTTRRQERYGPMAFPLDYPNAWDRVRARDGDGIWLHGVDPAGGRRPALDTDGCLAVPNDALVVLAKHLQVQRTPVIVTRGLQPGGPASIAADRDRLAAALADWERSFRDGDWQTYLGLYAEDFNYRGLARDAWAAWRVRSATARPLDDFRVDDVTLLADPEEHGLFLARFQQTISDDKGTIRTMKRLYWRLKPDGALEIVAEDNG